MQLIQGNLISLSLVSYSATFQIFLWCIKSAILYRSPVLLNCKNAAQPGVGTAICSGGCAEVPNSNDKPDNASGAVAKRCKRKSKSSANVCIHLSQWCCCFGSIRYHRIVISFDCRRSQVTLCIVFLRCKILLITNVFCSHAKALHDCMLILPKKKLNVFFTQLHIKNQKRKLRKARVQNLYS